MIRDPIARAEIQKHWNGVCELQQRIRNNTVFGFVGTGAVAVRNLSALAHNLPLLDACAVLNDALLQLRQEGAFSCGSIFLGALHNASKSALPWADWVLVQEVIKKRNRLAHDAVVVPVNDCIRYVDAIERELKAWKII